MARSESIAVDFPRDCIRYFLYHRNEGEGGFRVSNRGVKNKNKKTSSLGNDFQRKNAAAGLLENSEKEAAEIITHTCGANETDDSTSARSEQALRDVFAPLHIHTQTHIHIHILSIPLDKDTNRPVREPFQPR